MHALLLAFALAAPPDKPPATLDEKIAAALKNHPDVKAADAKRVLAEAELEQAKLTVTQKVTAAASKVELSKVMVMLAEEEVKVYERVMKLVSASEIEKTKYAKAIPALAAAKAELAAAEVELQQLVGKGVTTEQKAAGPSDNPKTERSTSKLPSGPAIDRLEAAVLKSVKLELKNVELSAALGELLKAAGAEDVQIRGGKGKTTVYPFSLATKGEVTFGAAMEMLIDEHNLANPGNTFEVYVREYGLLVEKPGGVAPKDAPTLAEFVKAVRARKE
jgi:outer membrane protein TolC